MSHAEAKRIFYIPRLLTVSRRGAEGQRKAYIILDVTILTPEGAIARLKISRLARDRHVHNYMQPLRGRHGGLSSQIPGGDTFC